MKLKFWFALSLTALTVACADAEIENNNDTNNASTAPQEECVDVDGDGYKGRTPRCPSGKDCNDASGGTNPGASEFCGDRLDNNCDGQIDEGCVKEEKKCTDVDGDRFGVGEGCFGPDCDDNNSDINPRATEICGNSIDEDCKGGDEKCPSNCTDVDGDGYGTAGSTDCLKPETDCDDSDPAVHPGATEVCNAKDDNCDTNTDECPFDGQSCVNDKCKGGVNVQCANNDDCVGSNSKCDATQHPKVCRITENGACGNTNECLDGLACTEGKCSGNWCDVNTCSGKNNVCDSAESGCVQCPYFDGFATADLACLNGNLCSDGGWCTSGSSYPYKDWDDLMTINIDLGSCWIGAKGKAKQVCWTYITDGTIQTITKQMAQQAWENGTYEPYYNADMIKALDDVWGKGAFNLEDIKWKVDIEANINRTICLWYDPGSTFRAETMVLDLCKNFTP